MTGFDIAVLVVVGFGAITGFARGFVHEILALMAWVASLFAIRYFHTSATAFVEPYVGAGTAAPVLAFAILLLVPYAAFRLIARWAGGRTRNSVLGPVDRVLGFGFGAIKGVIIVVIAFSVVVLAYDVVWGPGGRPTWITQSRTYPFVNASSEALVTIVAERRREAAEADSKIPKS